MQQNQVGEMGAGLGELWELVRSPIELSVHWNKDDPEPESKIENTMEKSLHCSPNTITKLFANWLHSNTK